MGYFQWIFKHQGILVAGIVLAFVLSLGCSTHNAENMSAPETPSESSAALESGEAGGAVSAVTGVGISSEKDKLTVWIQGSGPMTYTSIKQSFPFGIAVYLPDTAVAAGVTPDPIDDPDISGVRLGYADAAETTAKVEIFLAKDLSYTVKESDAALGIVIDRSGPEKETAPLTAMTGTPAETPGPSSPAPETGKMPAASAVETVPPAVSASPAAVTHVEFDTAPSGQSDIRVATSHPVRYEARQIGPDRIHLVLFNTTVPKIHQRPLLTRYFNSAVVEVLPRAASEDAYLDIKIREQVPYQLMQTRDGVHMAFEPSSVKPPAFDKAKISMGRETEVTMTPAMALPPAAAGVVSANPAARQTMPEDTLLGRPPVYTGEKIKLDFYDTDIKNVFRILRSVSGLNFAIDDDVQGKVTLSLEEPVPWDQVMDLILKMNGLGKKMEGNVVRIATLKTMADEEKALQNAIAARKQSLEQKESLAPLVTEYIPINYSDATKDIQPHVQQILTPDRGRLSVDSRTNMLIITDTQAKIDQAQDLIYRLDKVTPQIMIEARVVEVTKEFSRSLGLRYSMTNSATTIAGFVDDYSLAINQPNAGISGSFSFFRLFGSSMNALNAQLEASEELGDVRIVSSPRILTLDNKKAKIKQGLEYAYLERDDAGGSSVKFKDIDLLLEVTPHVTPDKRISMTVFLTKNDVAGVTATGIPTLATNEAETELLVNNNETVVIGGVVKTTKGDDTSGLPFLSGIPVLGSLFGIQQKTDNRNELLIFLTPSIVQLEQKRNLQRSVN